jgi:hypothetical protein
MEPTIFVSMLLDSYFFHEKLTTSSVKIFTILIRIVSIDWATMRKLTGTLVVHTVNMETIMEKKNVAMPWIKLASINNNNTSYFETRYIKRSVGNLSIVSRFFLQIKIENEADELKVCEILGSKVKF